MIGTPVTALNCLMRPSLVVVFGCCWMFCFWMFLDVFGWLAFAVGFIEFKYFQILKGIRNDAEVESHGDTDAAGGAAKEHHLTFGTTAPTVGSGG